MTYKSTVPNAELREFMGLVKKLSEPKQLAVLGMITNMKLLTANQQPKKR